MTAVPGEEWSDFRDISEDSGSKEERCFFRSRGPADGRVCPLGSSAVEAWSGGSCGALMKMPSGAGWPNKTRTKSEFQKNGKRLGYICPKYYVGHTHSETIFPRIAEIRI